MAIFQVSLGFSVALFNFLPELVMPLMRPQLKSCRDHRSGETGDVDSPTYLSPLPYLIASPCFTHSFSTLCISLKWPIALWPMAHASVVCYLCIEWSNRWQATCWRDQIHLVPSFPIHILFGGRLTGPTELCIRWSYTCMPPSEYNWTICARWWCWLLLFDRH